MQEKNGTQINDHLRSPKNTQLRIRNGLMVDVI